MPRRRVVQNPAVLFVHLEREEHQALREYADAQRASISDIVRELVAKLLASRRGAA